MDAYMGRQDEKAIARPFAAVISLGEVVNKNAPTQSRLRVPYSRSNTITITVAVLVSEVEGTGDRNAKVEPFNSHPSLKLDLFRFCATIARCSALAEFILANKNHITYICHLGIIWIS